MSGDGAEGTIDAVEVLLVAAAKHLGVYGCEQERSEPSESTTQEYSCSAFLPHGSLLFCVRDRHSVKLMIHDRLVISRSDFLLDE